jgi:hypothetical protein
MELNAANGLQQVLGHFADGAGKLREHRPAARQMGLRQTVLEDFGMIVVSPVSTPDAAQAPMC